METLDLYTVAKATLNPKSLVNGGKSGFVASALLSEDDNIYTGVAIDVACSIGFCAEHSAIASMITAGETKIKEIIAVHTDGHILPPCGRCREFIAQVDIDNDECKVHLPNEEIAPLSVLLPYPWDSFKK